MFSLGLPRPHNPCSLRLDASFAQVDKIKTAANTLCPQTFLTGAECALRREKVVFISTGSASLDALLGGGVQTGSITEGASARFDSPREQERRS